jgi:hypothetical protein
VRGVLGGRRSPPIAFVAAIADFSVSRLGTGLDLAVCSQWLSAKEVLQRVRHGSKSRLRLPIATKCSWHYSDLIARSGHRTVTCDIQALSGCETTRKRDRSGETKPSGKTVPRSFADRLEYCDAYTNSRGRYRIRSCLFLRRPTWASVMTAFIVIEMPNIIVGPTTEQTSSSHVEYRTPTNDVPRPSKIDSVHRNLDEWLRNGLASIVGRPFPSTYLDFLIIITTLGTFVFGILYVFAEK